MIKHHFTFIVSFILSANVIFAQVQISQLGAKPRISVNGDSCAIQNQQLSCVTRMCDSVVISQGDSVSFCTDAYIDLISDTSYYMQWDFNGSSNFSSSIINKTPTTLPLCYYPIWNSPGNYLVDVYYNGYLSAYPTSDCYPFPSHWIIKVIVLSPGGIDEEANTNTVLIFPNPSSGSFTINSEDKIYQINIINLLGEEVLTERLNSNYISIDMKKPSGIYFIELKTEKGTLNKKIVLEQ